MRIWKQQATNRYCQKALIVHLSGRAMSFHAVSGS